MWVLSTYNANARQFCGIHAQIKAPSSESLGNRRTQIVSLACLKSPIYELLDENALSFCTREYQPDKI